MDKFNLRLDALCPILLWLCFSSPAVYTLAGCQGPIRSCRTFSVVGFLPFGSMSFFLPAPPIDLTNLSPRSSLSCGELTRSRGNSTSSFIFFFFFFCFFFVNSLEKTGLSGPGTSRIACPNSVPRYSALEVSDDQISAARVSRPRVADYKDSLPPVPRTVQLSPTIKGPPRAVGSRFRDPTCHSWIELSLTDLNQPPPPPERLGY